MTCIAASGLQKPVSTTSQGTSSQSFIDCLLIVLHQAKYGRH